MVFYQPRYSSDTLNARRLDALRIRLFSAPDAEKPAIVATMTVDDARWILDYLTRVPGDDPAARRAIADRFPELTPEETTTMEIGGNNHSYPGGTLSNFSPHPFVLDGVACASMEGFLQSLKFKSPDMQVEVCTLVGIAAKRRGAKKNWRETQTLYWRGVPINRRDTAYQELLDRAYDALAENAAFRRALLASGDAVFTHAVGKTDPSQTVLTVREFTSRLTKIRARLRAQELHP